MTSPDDRGGPADGSGRASRPTHLRAPAPAPPDRGRVLRASVWLVLVVSTVGNALAPAVGVADAPHLGLAVVTASCVVALAVVHNRARRRAPGP